MKYIKTVLFSFLILFTFKVYSQNIPIPELKSPVTDLTGTLKLSEINLLEQKLLDFQKNNESQFVILIIPTTGDESIEEYSMRAAENWKIGSAEKDDGIILLVAKNDRTLRIEVGYGLEEKVTDAEAGFIINDIIVPEFKNGNFYSGINQGVDFIFKLINGEITSDINTLSDSNSLSENSESDGFLVFLILFLVLLQIVPFFMINSKLSVFIIVLSLIFSAEYLTGLYADDSDLALGFMLTTGMFALIPFLVNLINTLTGKKPKSGGFWSGGFSGGSWSSSSSSSSWSSSGSSGFSGGGGSFGGGGASGSW